MLGYPFLMDALSASMLCLGTGLQAAFIIPGSLMMGLVYLGFILLSWELTHSRAAVVVSYLLMFLNGGLGFFYVLDGVWQDPTALQNVFTGYYAAPANMVEHNIRWVNVICDMMIPQRTLLAGWTMVVPALYLLALAMRENSRRLYVILGVLAGRHAHGPHALVSGAGADLGGLPCLDAAPRRGPQKGARRLRALRRRRRGAGAAAGADLGHPPDGGRRSTTGSLSLRFNWVNYDDATGRLIDGYFWFWVKNVGPVYLLMLPAALCAGAGSGGWPWARCWSTSTAELIQFQPNPYDNNKLFYVAFVLMLPLAGSYLVALWNRLRGLPGRALLAAVFLALSLTSGALSLAREAVSDYQLFSADEVEAADYHPRRVARGRRLPHGRSAQQPGGGAGGAADRLRHGQLPVLPRHRLPAGRPRRAAACWKPRRTASRCLQATAWIMWCSATASATTTRWTRPGLRRTAPWSTTPAACASTPRRAK